MHAVIVALTSILDAALAVPVYDGPTPTSANDTEFVLVGSDGSDGDSVTADIGDRFAEFDDEDGEITCSAWSNNGAGDVVAARSAASALLTTCRAAIVADRTLGGTLAVKGRAVVTRVVLRQAQTSQGAAAGFIFTVTYNRTLT